MGLKSEKRKAAAPAGTRRAQVKAKSGQFVTRMYSASVPKATSKNVTKKPTVQVQFGSVIVQLAPPAKSRVKENVKAGASALKRVRSRLLVGGVRIEPEKDVPLFHADPEAPNRLVRKLNGEVTYGTFVNGKFKPSS